LFGGTALLLLVLVMVVGRVSAQEIGDPPITASEIPTLPDFLRFLAGPAGALFIGAAISPLLEGWAWYQQQDSNIKQTLAFAITAAVATLAYGLVAYVPPEFWVSVSQFWILLVYALFAVFGNQGWFAVAIKRARTVSVPVVGTLRRKPRIIGDDVADEQGA
jgi:uncharacterized membrane protein YfcA